MKVFSMDRLIEERRCEKCMKELNWRKILLKVSIKILISGLIKALITHIVLTHMKNDK